MDALEILRERRRMCKSFGTSCDGCPLQGYPCTSISSMNDGDLEKLLVEVEKWSKEHLRKTRQSVFLEQYPEASFDERGVMQLCPKAISAAHRGNNGECKNPEKQCIDCRREFWMQEVE